MSTANAGHGLTDIRLSSGKRIKAARTAKGLDRKELARRIPGLSYSALSMYERGERYPDPEIVSKISSEVGVSTPYLMGVSDDPDPYGRSSEIAEMLKLFSEDEKQFLLDAIAALAERKRHASNAKNPSSG